MVLRVRDNITIVIIIIITIIIIIIGGGGGGGGGGGSISSNNIGKTIPLQAWTGPQEFQQGEVPRLPDNKHMKVASLSALRTGHLYS